MGDANPVDANRGSEIFEAWNLFVTRGAPPGPAVKEEISQSWLRCRSYSVDPHGGIGPVVSAAQLGNKVAANRKFIDAAMPFMKDLCQVAGPGFVAVLTDPECVLLEMTGDPSVSRRAGTLNFAPGGVWSEATVGTNAIGTAVATDRPIQVCACEHYCALHHPWTCSAAPIHGQDGALTGVLDMTGPCELVHPHTLGMVMAAARAIENQIRWEAAAREAELSNRMMQSTFSSISEGVLTVDHRGIVRQVNPAAACLLGRPAGEILGEPVLAFLDESSSVARCILGRREYTDHEAPVMTPTGRTYCTSTGKVVIAPESRDPGMVVTLREAKGVHRLVHRIAGHRATFVFDDLVHCSDAMKTVIEFARHAAATTLNILITGETGTGKEMMAQAIHNASRRSRGPFVALNCGAIPRELIESELFGYEGGAFTGARREGRPGKFELADGGTVFLDEIGEMPLDMQVKLLRVVQDRKVGRLGSHDETPVDVRIMAASNVDLGAEVEKGAFRKDLFYRLNVMPIRMPSLRERPEDIPVLTGHFAGKLAERLGKPRIEVSSEVMDVFLSYSWPGNVRELENVLERAACIADRIITLEHIPHYLPGGGSGRDGVGAAPGAGMAQGAGAPGASAAPETAGAPEAAAAMGATRPGGAAGPGEAAVLGEAASPGARVPRRRQCLESVEREVILETLEACGWNVSRAARALRIGRNTIYRRLRKWGVSTQPERTRPEGAPPGSWGSSRTTRPNAESAID